MARKKKIIITVAVIAAVCGAVALGWHSLMSFDVTTDISDYIDTDEFEGTYGLHVFPDEARKEDVMEYYYAYRDIFFDPDVQLYLRCKYTPERYAEECERLSQISVSHEGQTHRIQYNTEDYTFPAYEAIHGYDCSYEYALLNEEEYTIEYVYLQFIREENIAFDRDRLPDDYFEGVYSGGESMQNLNIYAFPMSGPAPDFAPDFKFGDYIVE